MPRISASCEEALVDRLDAAAADRGLSRAEAIRRAVDHWVDHGGSQPGDAVDQADPDRITVLEERVAELEARITPDHDVDHAGSPLDQDVDQTDPPRITADVGGDADDELEQALAGWSHGRGAEELAASHEVALAALDWLRDQDRTVRKSDVPLDDLANADALDRATSTLWDEVVKDSWIASDAVSRDGRYGYRWTG